MTHPRRHVSHSSPRKSHRTPASPRDHWRRAVMMATVAATAALPHKRAHATSAVARVTMPSNDLSNNQSNDLSNDLSKNLKSSNLKNAAPKTAAHAAAKVVIVRARGPQVSTAQTLAVPSAIAAISPSAPLSKAHPLPKFASRARLTEPDATEIMQPVFAQVPLQAPVVQMQRTQVLGAQNTGATPVMATAVKPDDDRVLLAQLDQELQRTQAKLKASDDKLSEGQRQLIGLSSTLKTVMDIDGDNAAGLHPFVRVASRYIGTPYVWGGESRYGFDCSGFIIRVMRDLGYQALPHSAAEQFKYGTPVSQAFLKPGDLVFFANTYKPGISHVGIYIGKRRFIQAASTRQGTIISSLDSQPYARKYAGARRLISLKRA